MDLIQWRSESEDVQTFERVDAGGKPSMRLEAPATESEHEVDGGAGRDLEVLDRLVVAPALSANSSNSDSPPPASSAVNNKRQPHTGQLVSLRPPSYSPVDSVCCLMVSGSPASLTWPFHRKSTAAEQEEYRPSPQRSP